MGVCTYRLWMRPPSCSWGENSLKTARVSAAGEMCKSRKRSLSSSTMRGTFCSLVGIIFWKNGKIRTCFFPMQDIRCENRALHGRMPLRLKFSDRKRPSMQTCPPVEHILYLLHKSFVVVCMGSWHEYSSNAKTKDAILA